ncbi:patatin-like protein 1 [Solanum pennellii]|uniref:Patatin n=1 Tax=Solanum pennellii TaxID=28526 RepID=A0ABM1V2R2_SOLPN|nr:patatin-like protein 1 [Solanum pennellii]
MEMEAHNYVDIIIAGSSTGGLIATMLTAPNQQGRPLYAAKDIVPFYQKQCPNIFPQHNKMVALIRLLWGPKYDGKHPRNLIRGILGNRRLHETITHLLIPTYDIKTLEPQIFYSYEAKMDLGFDALLSDICIGTSSAPRPTGAKANLLPENVLDYGKYLVLSVPVAELDDYLSGDVSSTDKATNKCMENLVKIGNNILQKPISRMNLETCINEAVENEGTNEQALIRFTKLLSQEKTSH